MSWLLSFPCQREIFCVCIARLCSTGAQVQGNSKVSNGTIKPFHLLPCQSAFARAGNDCELLHCFPEVSCCLVHSGKINTGISKISSCLVSLLAVSAEGPRMEWTMSKKIAVLPLELICSAPDWEAPVGQRKETGTFVPPSLSILWTNKGH